MKTLLRSVMYILLLVLFYNAAANAANITLSGTTQFECNLLSKYMEKHGFTYLQEIPYNNFKTNLFAANNAEVIIKNEKNNAVLGTARTDKKGNFSISVPEDSRYRIIVRFHDREIEKTVYCSEAKNIIANVGYFDSGTVDNWIEIKPVSYCFTCNLRYHENKEPF